MRWIGEITMVKQIKKPQGNGVAAVLSFVIPGLGQVYNGELGKGIITAIIVLGLLALSPLTGFLCCPFGLIAYVANIYDAYTTKR